MSDASGSGSSQQAKLSVTSHPDPPQDSVLDAILDVAKSEMSTEMTITDRYERKAQAFYGFVVFLFGITQAFVLHSSFHSLNHAHSQHLKLTLYIAASLFAVATALVMLA